MGALGSILVTAFAGRMSFKVLRETMQATTKITAMMMFILICAQVFALAFRGLQGEDLIHALFEFLPGGVNADIWFLMLLIFVLGLLHRVDRDQLHRGAAVPAGVRRAERGPGVARRC